MGVLGGAGRRRVCRWRSSPQTGTAGFSRNNRSEPRYVVRRTDSNSRKNPPRRHSLRFRGFAKPPRGSARSDWQKPRLRWRAGCGLARRNPQRIERFGPPSKNKKTPGEEWTSPGGHGAGSQLGWFSDCVSSPDSRLEKPGDLAHSTTEPIITQSQGRSMPRMPLLRGPSSKSRCHQPSCHSRLTLRHPRGTCG